MRIPKDSVNQSLYFVVRSATTGQIITNPTITTLKLGYTRDRAEPVSSAFLTALTDPDDPHADNKAIITNATIAPGEVRVDFPDAPFATGVDRVQCRLVGTGIDCAPIEAELYTPPAAALAAIQAKTDGLNFSGTDVKATLDSETVTTDSASREASKADVSGLATAVALAAHDLKLDGVASDVTAIGLIVATLQTVLSDLTEDNAGTYRFAAAALALTPGLSSQFVKNQALSNFQFQMELLDGSPAVGKDVSGYVLKDGAADFVGITNDPAEVESAVQDGAYRVDFAAADTNADIETFLFLADGCRPYFFTVMPAS